ncbi:MAG TPA: protein kinase [Nocardioidaceae bacterium]|nr:protein kinase [Nocardioidaceae bacterium]
MNAPAQRYRLDSRIATGGMGEVWRGTDTVLDRQVAVKVLKAEYAEDPTFRTRFETEARHAAALHHPNVASVFDYGELDLAAGQGGPGTRPCLVMELVPGQPLSTLVSGEPLPAQTATDLVAQAADAIAAAHALGIVHRDVKPANLLVTPDGTVKITDFGIARAADGVALTGTGQIIGTPHYLSPEQAEGRAATPASDVYALGVVLYECLTGARPFQGDTPVGTALAHLREPVPDLPASVPEHLRAVVTRAMAKEPTDRYASARELADALRGHADAPTLLAGVGPGAVGGAAGLAAGSAAGVAAGGAAPAVSTATLAQPRERRRPGWLPWAGAAVAVALIAMTAAALTRGDGDSGAAADSATEGPTDTASASPVGPERVRLRETRFVGMDATRAAGILQGRGFTVQRSPHALPEDEGAGAEPGTVAAVDPHGRVRPDATVTLTVWTGEEDAQEDTEEDGGARPEPKPKHKPHGHDKPKHEPKPPKPGHDKHGPGHEKPKGAKK